MANRTVKDAHTVHGTNPQYLVEKIIRSRIYESRYWKEECFAVNEELLVERAAALKYIGGVHGGNIKPSPFLCLTLKMLQIQPAKDIVIEFIRQQDYKYARALGIFYLRLTNDSPECYRYLEPLFNDYRKLKRVDRQGVFSVIHMDEFVDELLREERACDVILPRLQKRHVLEEEGDLEPRVSLLDEALQDVRLSDAEEAGAGTDSDSDVALPRPGSASSSPPASPRPRDHHRHHQHQAPPQRHRRRSRSPLPPPPQQREQRERRRRSRSRSKSNSRSKSRSRTRSRSPAERRRKADAGSGEPKKKRKKDKDRGKEKDKEKEKEKDKDRGRDRDRVGKDRDKDRRDKERDRDRRHRDRGGRRSPGPDGGGGGGGGRGRNAHEEEEIREANKLRAELGIPLLKP